MSAQTVRGRSDLTQTSAVRVRLGTYLLLVRHGLTVDGCRQGQHRPHVLSLEPRREDVVKALIRVRHRAVQTRDRERVR